jgi:hypothetical protein
MSSRIAMHADRDLTSINETALPAEPVCADCARSLAEPYGWCANCRAAFCLACGRQHYCMASCRERGCLAGLCVRLVIGGQLAQTWGLPEPD